MSGARVDADRLLTALDHPVAPVAVAVVGPEGGSRALRHAAAAGRFELGSVTKTMTAQVLASLVVDGAVSLDDPVGTWLDAGVNGSITLEQLARHLSGLPRMAGNAEVGEGFDALDPYATYTADLAEAALREVELDPARAPLYSNFGYQLLGLALERAAQLPLASLLHERVFEPFGLATASLGPHPDLVQGFRDGDPVPPWRILLAGPGGVVGTIDDLLAWGAAVLDPPDGAAGDALRLALGPRSDGVPVGLGWQLHDGLVWHNGGTFGFHSCVAVSVERRRVVACLVGTSDLDHVDEAAFLSARGLDPVDARPEPAGDGLDAPALAVVDALAARDWARVRAAMSEQCRESLTAERLRAGWGQVMEPRGELTSARVRHARRRGQVVEVTTDLDFEHVSGWATVAFDHDGRVVGLLIG